MADLKYPIVLIRARDWNLFTNQAPATAEFDVMAGVIAGFLIRSEPDRLIVAHEYFESEPIEVRDVVVIPRECIVSIERIRGINENRKNEAPPVKRKNH